MMRALTAHEAKKPVFRAGARTAAARPDLGARAESSSFSSSPPDSGGGGGAGEPASPSTPNQPASAVNNPPSKPYDSGQATSKDATAAAPTTVNEIVVTAKKITFSSPSTPAKTVSYSKANNQATPGTMTYGPKSQHIKFAISNSKHNFAAQQAASILEKRVQTIEAKLASLPQSQKIGMPDGSTITVAQALTLLEQTDYLITDTTSSGGVGGANTVHTSGVNIVTFNLDTLLDYENSASFKGGSGENSTTGIDFILLHEVGHDTPGGLNSNTVEFNAYKTANPGQNPAGAGYQTDNTYGSPQFQANETYANTAGAAIQSAIGEANPTTSQIRYGYKK